MDTRLLDYYNRELAYLRERGGRSRSSSPKWPRGCGSTNRGRPIRTSSGCSKASLPHRARAAQDGRRVSALHAGAPRCGVSRLYRAAAVDGDRAVRAAAERRQPGARLAAAGRHRAARTSGRVRADRLRIPHRARPDAVAARTDRCDRHRRAVVAAARRVRRAAGRARRAAHPVGGARRCQTVPVAARPADVPSRRPRTRRAASA